MWYDGSTTGWKLGTGTVDNFSNSSNQVTSNRVQYGFPDGIFRTSGSSPYTVVGIVAEYSLPLQQAHSYVVRQTGEDPTSIYCGAYYYSGYQCNSKDVYVKDNTHMMFCFANSTWAVGTGSFTSSGFSITSPNAMGTVSNNIDDIWFVGTDISAVVLKTPKLKTYVYTVNVPGYDVLNGNYYDTGITYYNQPVYTNDTAFLYYNGYSAGNGSWCLNAAITKTVSTSNVITFCQHTDPTQSLWLIVDSATATFDQQYVTTYGTSSTSGGGTLGDWEWGDPIVYSTGFDAISGTNLNSAWYYESASDIYVTKWESTAGIAYLHRNYSYNQTEYAYAITDWREINFYYYASNVGSNTLHDALWTRFGYGTDYEANFFGPELLPTKTLVYTASNFIDDGPNEDFNGNYFSSGITFNGYPLYIKDGTEASSSPIVMYYQAEGFVGWAITTVQNMGETSASSYVLAYKASSTDPTGVWTQGGSSGVDATVSAYNSGSGSGDSVTITYTADTQRSVVLNATEYTSYGETVYRGDSGQTYQGNTIYIWLYKGSISGTQYWGATMSPTTPTFNGSNVYTDWYAYSTTLINADYTEVTGMGWENVSVGNGSGGSGGNGGDTSYVDNKWGQQGVWALTASGFPHSNDDGEANETYFYVPELGYYETSGGIANMGENYYSLKAEQGTKTITGGDVVPYYYTLNYHNVSNGGTVTTIAYCVSQDVTFSPYSWVNNDAIEGASVQWWEL